MAQILPDRFKGGERPYLAAALVNACRIPESAPRRQMRNGIPARKLLERVYVEGANERPGVPTEGVPALLKQAVPLHDVIKVDLHVPGCPPKPNAILFALSELLEGRKPDLGSKLRFG